mgnify:CR=1 FL=1
MWPAGFDSDGVMYCNTAFGDYPHYLPGGPFDAPHTGFTGWMLLNYNKPVTVSSTLGGYAPNYAVDEDIKTYWSAQTGNAGEWIASDLGETSEVYAIQINYADQDAEFLGKAEGIFHQYRLWHSTDGKQWQLLTDKSRNNADVPHDYIDLNIPVKTRYIKLENIHMPTGKFALCGLRVFGKGAGTRPEAVKDLIVLRTEGDKRSAWLKWKPVDNATGYNIYLGTDPDKLYNCIMVMGRNEYWLKTLDRERPYYFMMEAFNENGISDRSTTIKSE